MESLTKRFVALRRRGRDEDQQNALRSSIGEMMEQGGAQPTAALFGPRALSADCTSWFDSLRVFIRSFDLVDLATLEQVLETTSRWVARAWSRALTASSKAFVAWAKDCWRSRPGRAHGHVKDRPVERQPKATP